MKIAYTGRQVELAPAQVKKLEARFAKVGKLLDDRQEREAHVVLSLVRHLHNVEIAVNYYGHQLVGLASGTDLFSAISAATEKLEKQAVKARTKWRDTKRVPRKAEPEVAVEQPAAVESETEVERRIYRANQHQRRKPMTLDEALIEMEKDPRLPGVPRLPDRIGSQCSCAVATGTSI